MSQLRQHDFPRRLRALRTARGLTQRELAGGSLSVSYVSLLEAGRRNPTPETLQVLAERLGCSLDELTGAAESPQTRPPALSVRYGQLALEAGRADEATAHFETALATPDLDKTFARLESSGAEIVQEPIEQPYGVRDCAVRDPAGNLLRINEVR